MRLPCAESIPKPIVLQHRIRVPVSGVLLARSASEGYLFFSIEPPNLLVMPFTTIPISKIKGFPIVIFLVIGLLADSSKGLCEDRPPGSSFTQTTDDQPGPGFGAMDPKAVVAEIDGELITRADLDWEIESILGSSGGQNMTPGMLGNFRSQMEPRAFGEMALKIRLQAYAKSNGITISDASVESDLDRIRSQFNDKETLNKFLADKRITLETFKEKLRKDLTVHAALDHYMDSLPTPSKETTETYYQEHLEDYTKDERVTASHILMSTSSEASPEDKEKKRAELEGIRTQLVGGAEFAAMAKEHSSCPSSSKGGDLGEFGQGQMVKPFEEAAFSLEPGEISEIVETQFGYHIIQVAEHNQAETPPYETVKEEVETKLKQEVAEKWFEELKAKAVIVKE